LKILVDGRVANYLLRRMWLYFVKSVFRV